MKYAKDTRPKGVANKAAEVLVEALPWIKNITGKTVVIKCGGSAMVDEQLRADVMNDIVLLKIVGVNPVIVHGGGKAITEAMDFLQLPVEFKDGQRVTTPEAMDLVRTVLMGKVNQELVEALDEHGNFAVGVPAAPTRASSWPNRPARSWDAWAASRASTARFWTTSLPATTSPSWHRWRWARTAASTT